MTATGEVLGFDKAEGALVCDGAEAGGAVPRVDVGEVTAAAFK